jgi:hypothetical protein
VTKSVCLVSRQRIVGGLNGSSIYILSIVKYLTSRGLQVHYICPTPAVFGRWPMLLLRKEMSIFSSYQIRGSIRFGRLICNPSLKVLGQAILAVLDVAIARAGLRLPKLSAPPANSFFSQEPLCDTEKAYLRQVASKRADAILCDYAKMTTAIEPIARSDAPTAVVMHDLFSAQYPDVDAATEFGLLAKAGLIIAIQADEAGVVSRTLPGHRIVVAPMAVEPAAAPFPGDSDSVLFVGSNTFPNVEALKWFVQEVWPILVERRPTLSVNVAGTVSRGMGPVPTGIRLLGLVSDLGHLYHQAGVVISPLRSGTGLKIKLIEAMGRGKAVVATPVTTQGVRDLVEEIVRVAVGPAEFARAILMLASDTEERKRLGARGIQLVRDRFNPDSCYGPIYDYLSGAPPV